MTNLTRPGKKATSMGIPVQETKDERYSPAHEFSAENETLLTGIPTPPPSPCY